MTVFERFSDLFVSEFAEIKDEFKHIVDFDFCFEFEPAVAAVEVFNDGFDGASTTS